MLVKWEGCGKLKNFKLGMVLKGTLYLLVKKLNSAQAHAYGRVPVLSHYGKAGTSMRQTRMVVPDLVNFILARS